MIHKARKINIAYRSSKWWQWCKARHQPRWLLHSGRDIVFQICWIVFIHVAQGCPFGLFQFSKGEAVRLLF